MRGVVIRERRETFTPDDANSSLGFACRSAAYGFQGDEHGRRVFDCLGTNGRFTSFTTIGN
jgi:hypothetical protein